MDYEAFQAMTEAEAADYLGGFLDVGRAALDQVAAATGELGIVFDYSLETLPRCLEWIIHQVRISYAPFPNPVPQWVTSSHPRGLVQFDDESASWLLRGGYYLGQCFAQQPGLSWGTGDPDFIEKNMPVIKGFGTGDELPPLVVFKNLCLSLLDQGKPASLVESTIEEWHQKVTGQKAS